MLVTGSWENKKTFKMIPVTPDCPYNEAIYDLDSKVLAIISKEKKQSLHMIAKLDDNGDIKTLKVGRRSGGKEYAEERKTLETYYEYYLENADEIVDVINLLAVNADTFDYNQFLNAAVEETTNSLVTV